jgi:hypothetical protein
MWQVYPYGHSKLKLNKDLKTAEAHLRISLIDSEQIENMNRVTLITFRSIMIGRTTIESILIASLCLSIFNSRLNKRQLII